MTFDAPLKTALYLSEISHTQTMISGGVFKPKSGAQRQVTAEKVNVMQIIISFNYTHS